MYSPTELLTSLLQFFAMDANAQLEYAKGITKNHGEENFPFGLDHSPLIEMVNGTHNIARVFSTEKNTSSEAVEALEDFEAVLELMSTQRLDEVLNWTPDSLKSSASWRVVRKLSQIALQKLKIPLNHPAIDYERLIPFVMD